MRKNLFQPLKLGRYELTNRIALPPLTRCRSTQPGNIANELMASYYRQRSSAGFMVTEGTVIEPRGRGYAWTPGIYTPEQVEGWKKVTKAVHNKDGKIYAQLWHVGRMSHPYFHNGALPLAPSAVNPNDKVYTPEGFKDTVAPKEMTQEDIEKTIADFKQAAIYAKEAGFDGVEIHSSNGYLFHQFFNNSSNKRTDDYGGNIVNKTRFFFEVLEEIKTVFPENRIGIRRRPNF